MEIARYLTQKIGPRVSGSPEEVKAVDYLQEQFSKLGLQTTIQSFDYLGYEQLDGPSLEMIAPSARDIAVCPMAYTGSTPEEGVVGTLRYHGISYLFPRLMEPPKYAVIDEHGKARAFILVNEEGVSRPMPNPWFQVLQEPVVWVGGEEFKPLKRALDAGEKVTVRLKTVGRYVANFTSHNLIMTLPGDKEDAFIVGGHHDSVEGSPGANDNAAGVEGMYRLAKRLIDRRPSHTVKFITWGGHEWGLFGSQYFVRDCKERGTLKTVKACISLDVLGCGDFLWIWAGPKSFRTWLEKTLDDPELNRRRKIRFEDGLIGADDESFASENIPHAMFMEWPIDSLHLPEDRFENIDEGKMLFTVDAAQKVITSFDTFTG